MSGEICSLDLHSSSSVDPGAMVCSLPAKDAHEAATFLDMIGTAGLSTGYDLMRMGVNMPQIRMDYEEEIRKFKEEFRLRRKAKHAPRDIAKWAVAERRRIANRMRWRSGAGTRVLFEVRDWAKYGVGGRTFPNVERRYRARGFEGKRLTNEIIRGATKPNADLTERAMKSAKYLKHGGRVILVVSIGATAHKLMTADEAELERIAYEEVGSFAAVSLGTSLGVGACLVFGIASGGWGLLACGIVGGAGGSIVGGHVGRKFYSRTRNIEERACSTGIIEPFDLLDEMPPGGGSW